MCKQTYTFEYILNEYNSKGQLHLRFTNDNNSTTTKIVFLNLFIHNGRVSLIVTHETIDPINRPQPK